MLENEIWRQTRIHPHRRLRSGLEQESELGTRTLVFHHQRESPHRCRRRRRHRRWLPVESRRRRLGPSQSQPQPVVIVQNRMHPLRPGPSGGPW